jgi:hypothetical protein
MKNRHLPVVKSGAAQPVTLLQRPQLKKPRHPDNQLSVLYSAKAGA